MNKWIKKSLYVLFALVLVGFICIFATPLNHVKTISCVGSSGVKPFVEEYVKNNLDHKKIDVNVDAGGSGFGINQVANNYTNIGTVSKNPFNTVKESYKSKWIENKIKTITIGWEGICIVYIPPKGISNDLNLNSILNLTQDNITDLYRTFSGYKDGLSDVKPHLSLFLDVNANLSLLPNDIQLFKNQAITPYTRSGGSLTSGTAASFFECCHFDKYLDGLSDRQIEAFKNGNYGNDFKLYDTDEANSRAWSVFNSNKIPGSMIYLSASFVQQNYNLIKSNKYGILSYNNIEFDVNKIANGYNFFRPLNLLLSIDNSTEIKKLIDDILSYSLDVGFLNLGAQKINKEQYKSMCKNTNENSTFWVSDQELLTIRNDSWDDDGTIFGAIE
ncbi:MAG: substrate-binding domain-containing protein [Mycoplasma sp.]|nr:substrate-binding domain-containing protein [Mycoplasma sp.]